MDRRQLEGLWHTRVIDASLRYDFASSFLNEVAQDFPSSLEHAHALRAESAARADYVRVLRLYSELILQGTIPDEEEWQKRKAAGQR